TKRVREDRSDRRRNDAAGRTLVLPAAEQEVVAAAAGPDAAGSRPAHAALRECSGAVHLHAVLRTVADHGRLRLPSSAAFRFRSEELSYPLRAEVGEAKTEDPAKGHRREHTTGNEEEPLVEVRVFLPGERRPDRIRTPVREEPGKCAQSGPTTEGRANEEPLS